MAQVILDGAVIVAMTNLWRYDPVKPLRAFIFFMQLVEREREEALEIPKKKGQESHSGLDFENYFFKGKRLAVAVSR
jgi:hypothetical protein